MSVIRPGGPDAETQPNNVKPGTIVEWTQVDSPEPIIIKATPVTVQLTPRLVLPEATINFPGDDDERDFAVKPNREDIQRIIHAKAESEQRAATRPLPEATINISGEEPWPYVVKIGPQVPRPDLKFNPESYTYIPANVKSPQPRYRITQEDPTVIVPPKTGPDNQISARPW